MISLLSTPWTFQSTLSLRRATWRLEGARSAPSFQSTLSLRRATGVPQGVQGDKGISIHALLAESDYQSPGNSLRQRQFQSTLSLRRATVYRASIGNNPIDFNPRSPCGERRDFHTVSDKHEPISIHALLAESDTRSIIRTFCASNFNPRSPCGERREVYQVEIPLVIFQSTLSLRRATSAQQIYMQLMQISIHALLAESDQDVGLLRRLFHAISIHALLAESDPDGRVCRRVEYGISIHALLAESDSKYHQIGPIVSV